MNSTQARLSEWAYVFIIHEPLPVTYSTIAFGTRHVHEHPVHVVMPRAGDRRKDGCPRCAAVGIAEEYVFYEFGPPAKPGFGGKSLTST